MMSYSIYLWHMLVYGVARAIWPVDALPGLGKLGLKLGSLTLTLLLSRWLYRHFELVFLRLRPSGGGSGTAPLTGLASR